MCSSALQPGLLWGDPEYVPALRGAEIPHTAQWDQLKTGSLSQLCCEGKAAVRFPGQWGSRPTPRPVTAAPDPVQTWRLGPHCRLLCKGRGAEVAGRAPEGGERDPLGQGFFLHPSGRGQGL